MKARTRATQFGLKVKAEFADEEGGSVMSDFSQNNPFVQALDQLEQSYITENILCRDKEMKEIEDFILDGIKSRGSRQICYISGTPGNGKTLCVKSVIEKIKRMEMKEQSQATFVYLNAMKVKHNTDIYKALYYHLSGVDEGSIGAMYKLNSYFQRQPNKDQSKMFRNNYNKNKVIVIDEIDFLSNKSNSVIYNLCEWTQKRNSHIIMITISNTLHFPETLSTTISSRFGKSSICFKPYTSSQVQVIINQRISNVKIFQPTAISYICKKIAKNADIRKTLAILREGVSAHIFQVCAPKSGKMSKTIPNIRIETLVAAHSAMHNNTFTQYFQSMPFKYKKVLYALSQYFQMENISCSFYELQQRTDGTFESKPQLKAVIYDLRDLGLIKIRFDMQRKDKRIASLTQFIPLLYQQHITLSIDRTDISYAVDRDPQYMLIKKGVITSDTIFDEQ